MDLPIISRVYFDQKPPLQEEAIQRLAGKHVQITYELEVKRTEASQRVNEMEKLSKTNVDTFSSSKLVEQLVEQCVAKLKSNTAGPLLDEHKEALIQSDFGVASKVLKDILQ
jgi:hypothetical protein